MVISRIPEADPPVAAPNGDPRPQLLTSPAGLSLVEKLRVLNTPGK